jgi:hypothetical protein
VTMEVNEYEFFLDIRKFMKLSWSLLLYLAISEILINHGRKFSYNEFFDKCFYGMQYESMSPNHISWRIFWLMADHSEGFGCRDGNYSK